MNDESPETEKSSLGKFYEELRRRKVVRVALVYLGVGWLIVQVASATFGQFGIPVWAYRFVVLLVAMGFPLSMVLAWAFQLTPDGIATTKAAREGSGNLEATSKEHNRRRNWLAYGIGAAIPTVIFGGAALFFYLTLSPGREAGTSISNQPAMEQGTASSQSLPSIAVLPFDNRSNREEDAFFTDGIHDDLLTQISRIKAIRTVSRTSVMVYRNTTDSIPQIGASLKVDYILEGGVQRAGNQVRINVQLIEADADAHLWAETYDRELTVESIFTIQSEIATRIAKALQAELLPEEVADIQRMPTGNLEALEAYYRANEQYSLQTPEGHQRAIELYEKAVELDPAFAEAYLGIARTIQNEFWVAGKPPTEQARKAQAYLDRAMELNDRLSEAYVVKGSLLAASGDYEGSFEAYKQAIRLDPDNLSGYRGIGWNYRVIFRDAVGERNILERYFERIPMDDTNRELYWRLLRAEGKTQAYIRAHEDALAEDRDNANIHWNLARALRSSGKIDRAMLHYRKAHALRPANAVYCMSIAWCLFDLGRIDEVRYWVERASRLHSNPAYSLSWKAEVWWEEKEEKKAVEASLKVLQAERPAWEWFITIPLRYYLKSGQPEQAIELIRQNHPELFHPYQKVNGHNFHPAIYLGFAYAAIGNQTAVEALLPELRRILDRRYRTFDYHYSKLKIAFLSGGVEYASNETEQFFLAGGSPYTVESNGIFEELLAHPHYIELAEKRKAELAKQWDRIQSMEANGELASIPPLEEGNPGMIID
jgi:TolB-like protein/Tfp pilus assembly protein PilF